MVIKITYGQINVAKFKAITTYIYKSQIISRITNRMNDIKIIIEGL